MRVDRCFAFVDRAASPPFAELHGDERVVLVLAELRTALREASARRGVRIVKWLGDGAMLSSTMIDAVAALVVNLDVHMTEAIPKPDLDAIREPCIRHPSARELGLVRVGCRTVKLPRRLGR